MKYDPEYGPDEAIAATIRDHGPAEQAALYEELKLYSFAPSVVDEDGNIVNADYYNVGSIDGIEYYTPNDETWGAIIAISHKDKLALWTSFYEMDDMEYPDSDYAMVVVGGKMGCRFQMIPYDAAMMDPESQR